MCQIIGYIFMRVYNKKEKKVEGGSEGAKMNEVPTPYHKKYCTLRIDADLAW